MPRLKTKVAYAARVTLTRDGGNWSVSTAAAAVNQLLMPALGCSESPAPLNRNDSASVTVRSGCREVENHLAEISEDP
jgi:hypothetical protein